MELENTEREREREREREMMGEREGRMGGSEKKEEGERQKCM